MISGNAIHPGRGPFTLGDPGAPKVLLFHGLTGAPSELWPLGLALATAGYRVEAPVLPGHGTTPEDLARVSAEDVVRECRRLAADPEVVVIGGLSMGALLSLIMASDRPGTAAIVLMATALRLSGRNRIFTEATRVPGLAHLPIMISKGTPDKGTGSVHAEPADHHDAVELAAARAAEDAQSRPGEDGRYDRIPVRWGREMRRLQQLAEESARGVTCPALVLHGLLDRTAGPENAQHVARLLGRDVRIRFFPESPHVLMLGPERGTVAAEVVRFLKPIVPANGARAAESDRAAQG